MSAVKLQYLANKASNEFLNNKTPLNDVITKLAKENNLNSDQISRVCEIANLKAFNMATKEAAKNTISFDLADPKEIKKRLGLDKKKEKTAAPLDIEYTVAPDFLHRMYKAASISSIDIDIKKYKENIENAMYPHRVVREKLAKLKESLKKKELLKELNKEKIALELKIMEAVNTLTKQIKLAAIHNEDNPFVFLPKITKKHPELKQAAEFVFKKAAEELVNEKYIDVKSVLNDAIKTAAKNTWKELGDDGGGILHKLDTISGYMKLYEAVQNSIHKTKDSTELTEAPWNELKIREVIDKVKKLDIDKGGR